MTSVVESGGVVTDGTEIGGIETAGVETAGTLPPAAPSDGVPDRVGCLTCDRLHCRVTALRSVFHLGRISRDLKRIRGAHTRSALRGIRRAREQAREQLCIGGRHRRRLRHRHRVLAVACRSKRNDSNGDPRTQDDCSRRGRRLEHEPGALGLERHPVELAKQAGREEREPGKSPPSRGHGLGGRANARHLEPPAQRSARTEQESLDRCMRKIHPVCDLRV